MVVSYRKFCVSNQTLTLSWPLNGIVMEMSMEMMRVQEKQTNNLASFSCQAIRAVLIFYLGSFYVNISTIFTHSHNYIV